MSDWFTRPVFHVRDVAASLRFYVDQAGFTSPWHYSEADTLRVAEVQRNGCAIILASTWAESHPERTGKGLVFVSLNIEPFADAVAALEALRAEMESHGIGVEDGSWGYRLLIVTDPDGNQIFFNYPHPPE